MAQVIKKLAWASMAALACGSGSTAFASEDYDLRYAPGVGGADMSAPFEAGWVFQAPVYVYTGKVNASSTLQTDLTGAPFGVPIPGANAVTTIDSRTRFQIQGLLPRLSYMSDIKFLGATVGGTALLPLLRRKTETSIRGVATTVNAPGLPAANAAAIGGAITTAATATADALAAANSNAAQGIGDLELSPILRWSTEQSQLLFIATVVFPTGDYRATRAANSGSGKFYTFRPAVQYSYIGDGWDVGGRAAFSVNTRNTATHYKTGNYLNLDATLMKSINDSLRIGAAAYAVVQTTRDTIDIDEENPVIAAREAPTLGQKGHVYGVGPEIAYIRGAGEYLLEGRVMQEFGGDVRPQGTAFWMTYSKPF